MSECLSSPSALLSVYQDQDAFFHMEATKLAIIIGETPPDKGLESLTSGLKVPRSTDWANRVRQSKKPGYLIERKQLEIIFSIT